MAISLTSRHVFFLTSKMASNGSYAGERPPSSGGDIEFANDPASGGFFATDFKKHEDLKNMLDGNKDGLKLEAMKRIIGMVAKGKDASDLFPAVVKNVVSKNLEVKKLVYVYLVRYAEEQQDLALLSISTFQRALKDPNQLIRASALRVLSSIRVPVIVPIMMLAIKDSANDMSPYVRKTAAHAIPKLYSLDPEQRDQLIEVIEKLLSDKTTLVVGSAVMAFEEVCPERVELIHKNYRKLCNLLVDVEEWGQVIIIHMLTRYARTQFMDPNKDGQSFADDDKNFYDSDDSKEKEDPEEKPYVMDADHRLLLRNCKPLLQSRNAAVVMAVAQLYYYIAPRNEITIIAKALIRLLHSHREVQSVVLSNIATITTKNKGIFEPYLKNFFVRSSEPTHIKLLKLEVLTNLATETNISVILREFQTYVGSQDMEFVGATIQAIGRCASTITEVTDTCLNGLVLLLSNRNEQVVAESVVVIKKLLQLQPSEYKNIIIHMAKLVDSIAVPMARASILWLLGEYADRVPKIAPDVLRKVAKTFITEEDIVKLQTLNLAAKLFITNPKQTRLLTQYVFSLAKYDQNYDIRDRARFLRQLIMPQGEANPILSKYAKRVLLATKPAPILQSKFKDRDQFLLGSLSHFINSRASGYHELPGFPETAPDASVRNVEVATPWQDAKITKKPKKIVKKSSFYSETESSSGKSDNESGSNEYINVSSGGSNSGSESEDDSGSETEDSEESSSDGSTESENEVISQKVKVQTRPKRHETTEESSSEEDNSDSNSDDDVSSESSSGDNRNANKKVAPPAKPKSNLDLLLDLDDSVSVPVMQAMSTPSIPIQASYNLDNKPGSKDFNSVAPAWVSQKQIDLLNRYSSDGLTVTYRFPRNRNIFSPKMTTIELTFKNEGTDPVKGIAIPDKKIGNMDIKGFPAMSPLSPNSTAMATLGIDYNESTNPAGFELRTDKRTFKLTIKSPIGEIVQPVLMSETEFVSCQDKLKGMNENVSQVTLPEGSNNNDKTLISKVYEVANVLQVSSLDLTLNKIRFAGQTLSTKSPVLVSVQCLDNGKGQICVNCEKMVIGSVLMRELKEALSK